MSISVACPNCRSRLKAPDDLLRARRQVPEVFGPFDRWCRYVQPASGCGRHPTAHGSIQKCETAPVPAHNLAQLGGQRQSIKELYTHTGYAGIGFITGLAVSVLTCGVCTAVDGDIITSKPPGQQSPNAVFTVFIAEVVLPFLGLIVGLVLAEWRRRPEAIDPDDPSRPPK